MTTLTIFDYDDRSVRSVMIDGAPWFVGKDICACLEIADHKQALDRLDEDEARNDVAISTAGGAQSLKIVSEFGVYRLVFSSRTEAAERFKRWLAHEVIPAIRRTGSYSMAGSTAGATPQPRPRPATPYAALLDALGIHGDLRLLDCELADERVVQATFELTQRANNAPLSLAEVNVMLAECLARRPQGDRKKAA